MIHGDIHPAVLLVRVIWSEAPGLRLTSGLSAFTKVFSWSARACICSAVGTTSATLGLPAAPMGFGRFLVHQTKRGFFWSTYQYQWPSTSFHALGIGTFSGVP